MSRHTLALIVFMISSISSISSLNASQATVNNKKSQETFFSSCFDVTPQTTNNTPQEDTENSAGNDDSIQSETMIRE